MSGETYFDNPLSFDWEKVEQLDQIDAHDADWKIETRHTQDRICYDIEAVGTYSIGELVEVKDIEIKWASGINEI